MLSNKIRNDTWWLMKCFDYLVDPLRVDPSVRDKINDFRDVIKSKMEEYATEVDSQNRKTLSSVSLEIKEAPVPKGSPTLKPSVSQFVDLVGSAHPPPAPPAMFLSAVARASPWPSAVSAPAPSPAPVKVTKVEEEDEVEEEEEEEEEDDEVEVDEEALQQAKVSARLLPKEEKEEKEEEEEAEEEEAEEEEAEEEAEEENYEPIRIKKRTYWLETNSKKLYEYKSAEDVGDHVGNYKLLNGVATVAPL